MINIYIDESGSLKNPPTKKSNKFFFMPMLVLDSDSKAKKMRRIKRRFVSKNMPELKRDNDIALKRFNKKSRETMFYNGKFLELKGSCLSYEMSSNCIDYIFLKNSTFKKSVFLVKIFNEQTTPKFYTDKEVAFNYLLKISLIRLNKDMEWKNQDLHIHIDNRKIANKSINNLEKYLNSQLCEGKEAIFNKIMVTYWDSEQNDCIQVIDLVANIHYSSVFNPRYKNLLDNMTSNDIVIRNFKFPI